MANNPVKESATPFFTHVFSDSVATRVYSDSRPHNLKIAQLQKGLILLFRGAEVVGEGIGFGVPVIKYTDETYFSGKARLQVTEKCNHVTISKEYSLDLVARDQIRNIRLDNLSVRRKIDTAALLYQKNKVIAALICRLKAILAVGGVQSNFIEAASKGKVTVTYTFDGNGINVKSSFEQLDRKNLQQILILNEQGAHFFRKYVDSEGSLRFDGEIGAWDKVAAQSATIAEPRDKVGFTLKATKGATLRRGREVARGSLDWVGLDYEVDPECRVFEYEIEISGENADD